MSTLSTKILLVEDNPADARFLREAIAEITESQFELTLCETLALAIESILCDKTDVVLTNLMLPDAQGSETVRRLHRAAPEVPIVVLTAVENETLAIQSLQEGAQDYLAKGQIDGGSLWRALRYAMERQRVQLELLNLSLIDDLTGLNNRRGFLRLGEHHAKLAYRTGKPFLVAFIDLDGMKQINDTFGHQEGNHALVDASNILKDSFRQSDILARIGGDEFAALVVEASDESVETIIHRIQHKLDSLNADPGRRYDLSLSIGIAAADLTEHADLEVLLSQADALMYQHKNSKRF
jgi:diguanylate cyclase (GGDEF)-like protein